VYFSLYKNDCPVTVAPLAFAVKNSSILVAKKTLALHPPPQIFCCCCYCIWPLLSIDGEEEQGQG